MKIFDGIIKVGLILGFIWLGPGFLEALTEEKKWKENVVFVKRSLKQEQLLLEPELFVVVVLTK